jgi:2-hydroxychromene-2-carboxylate isomerase
MRIYLDLISPYAYLGWTQIRAIAKRFDRDVAPVPVLFPAMLDAFGTFGPAEIPAKRSYVMKDIVRKAKLLGVPLLPPPVHPFVPLLPLRVATAAPLEERAAVIDALFDACWGRGEAIDSTEAIEGALKRASIDPAIIERASTPPVKRALIEATREAIEAGVFGVPTVVVDGEAFWGVDALPSLEQFLRGEDPITPELVARFDAIPIGAKRKAVAERATRDPSPGSAS